MGTDMREKLWVFDFDGTLSPLVAERDEAKLHPACRRLLVELVKTPFQRVAILSSRRLDDLIPRVTVRGLFLGGGSGTEWRIPEGHRLRFGSQCRLREARLALLPELAAMADLPGVELEDKNWSVALHTRKAKAETGRELLFRLDEWRGANKVKICRGPDVLEVQFLPEVDKAFGLRTLCQILKFDPSDGRVVYAGDDGNDAIAMSWVDYLGGIAITVGDSPLVAGARVVRDQPALVREIRGIAGMTTTSLHR